jgi:hypothetical protein
MIIHSSDKETSHSQHIKNKDLRCLHHNKIITAISKHTIYIIKEKVEREMKEKGFGYYLWREDSAS